MHRDHLDPAPFNCPLIIDYKSNIASYQILITKITKKFEIFLFFSYQCGTTILNLSKIFGRFWFALRRILDFEKLEKNLCVFCLCDHSPNFTLQNIPGVEMVQKEGKWKKTSHRVWYHAPSTNHKTFPLFSTSLTCNKNGFGNWLLSVQEKCLKSKNNYDVVQWKINKWQEQRFWNLEYSAQSYKFSPGAALGKAAQSPNYITTVNVTHEVRLWVIIALYAPHWQLWRNLGLCVVFTRKFYKIRGISTRPNPMGLFNTSKIFRIWSIPHGSGKFRNSRGSGAFWPLKDPVAQIWAVFLILGVFFQTKKCDYAETQKGCRNSQMQIHSPRRQLRGDVHRLRSSKRLWSAETAQIQVETGEAWWEKTTRIERIFDRYGR